MRIRESDRQNSLWFRQQDIKLDFNRFACLFTYASRTLIYPPPDLFKIDKWFGFDWPFHIKLREFRKMNYNPKPGDSKLVTHRTKIADEHRLVVGH